MILDFSETYKEIGNKLKELNMKTKLRDFIIDGRTKLKKENLQKFIVEKLSNSDKMELNIEDEEWVLDYLKEEGFYIKDIGDYNVMVFLYESDMKNYKEV